MSQSETLETAKTGLAPLLRGTRHSIPKTALLGYLQPLPPGNADTRRHNIVRNRLVPINYVEDNNFVQSGLGETSIVRIKITEYGHKPFGSIPWERRV
jgi:hypothetical protein